MCQLESCFPDRQGQGFIESYRGVIVFADVAAVSLTDKVRASLKAASNSRGESAATGFPDRQGQGFIESWRQPPLSCNCKMVSLTDKVRASLKVMMNYPLIYRWRVSLTDKVRASLKGEFGPKAIR